ncbi:hypothetical protein Aperf_G00000107208 [Anoplocephala perfoliata]
MSPACRNGHTTGIGVSSPSPSSNNLLRAPVSFDNSSRPPSTSVANFAPLSLYTTDSATNSQLLRVPPPAVPPNTSVVASIPMPGAAAPSITRGPLTYSTPPTATSTTASTTGRHTVLMPRQQPPTVLTPVSHPPINRVSPLFTSSSILRTLKARAKSEMSSILRLDPAVLLDRGTQPQDPIRSNRTGFHVCCYCQRIFSSPSLFANHLNRPVARILYRCHLCPSTSDTVVPALRRTPSVESGNLSAPNLCALYAHMAQCHANQPPSAWKLIPSRLSVTAIPWLTGNLEGLKRRPSSVPQTIYSDGQELVDLGNDIDRRLTNMLRSYEFHFLPSESVNNEGTFLLGPDLRFNSILSGQFTSTPDSTSSNTLSKDGLPTSLTSPISHFLFRLAEASPWLGHFFLTGWYPTLQTSDTQEASIPPPPAASFEEIQQAYEVLLKDSQNSTSSSSSSSSPSSFSSLSLRCMLCCDFRTDSSTALRNHFTGCCHGADMAPAKCALCSLSVVHNRRDTLLCSIKAHLLFHLDIYLICPQCGFTPPPDLPPPLAEACLRLHLRFVCFHFNLMRVLLCSKPVAACRERIFLSMENFVQHWFETHTARKYACQLCGSSGSQGKLEGGLSNESINDSVVRLSGLPYEFQDMTTVCTHLQERHTLSPASAPTFSMVAYECSECSFISSLPVDFADHFSSTHCRLAETGGTDSSTGATQSRQSPCECRCFYRCFGECRQILPTLDGLRAHMRTCVYALSALKQAFGDLLFNSPADKLSQNSGSDSDGVNENPLCRCLYCDVSTKKNDVSVAGRRDDPETQSTSSSNTSAQPNTYQSAKAFSDLQQLHAHEHAVHVTGGAVAAVASSSNGGQVGCPWCAEKLTLKKTLKSEGSIADGLLRHLRTHAMANPYVAWQMERVKRFNENQDEVVTCHCHTGWLDSPLTLMAHAAALPTSTNTYRGSSQRRKFGDVALLPFPSLFAAPPNTSFSQPVSTPPSIEIVTSKSSISTTTQTVENGVEESEAGRGVKTRGKPLETGGITTVKFLYQPGGHPPLSKEVYEHLRFGQYYELDERLKAFNTALVSDDDVTVAAKAAFKCPLCPFHGGSRWALTEHAFFSHWLRLCYVCCEHIYDESRRNINSEEKSIWNHIYACLNCRHKAILSSKSNQDVLNEDLDIQIQQQLQQMHPHPRKKRRFSALGGQTENSLTGSAEVMPSPTVHLPTSSSSAAVAVGEDCIELDADRFRDPPSATSLLANFERIRRNYCLADSLTPVKGVGATFLRPRRF